MFLLDRLRAFLPAGKADSSLFSRISMALHLDIEETIIDGGGWQSVSRLEHASQRSEGHVEGGAGGMSAERALG
jgi:hypothetical protein